MDNQQAKWPVFPPAHFLKETYQTNKLFLITGESGTGKTSWCQQWVESVRADGRRVGGLLSPAVITDSQKVAIDLVDLATGERQQLAKARHTISNPDVLTTTKWQFDTAVLTWGNAVLRRVTAVDLLIIDELGPLEFERGQGLQAAFQLIEAACYGLAGVVVRPSLLATAQQHWPWAQTILVSREPAG